MGPGDSKSSQTRTQDPPVEVSGGTLGELAMGGFCPRCFWLGLRLDLPFQRGLPGIFSSIDAFTKNVVHAHFDREHRLPPWFPEVGPVTGYEGGLHYRRFRFADPVTSIVLTGVPDDVFRLRDGSLHIVDYKTARFTPAQDALLPKYEVQLNAYGFIAEGLAMGRVSGLSLVYLEPRSDRDAGADGLRTEGPALGFAPKQVRVEFRPRTLLPPLLRTFRSVHTRTAPPEGAAGCRNCAALGELLEMFRKQG